MTGLEYIGSIGGIGAVFAVIMFFIYRQTIRQMRDDRKYMEDRLTAIINENFKIRERSTDAIIKHIQVLSELITWLKAKNGSR